MERLTLAAAGAAVRNVVTRNIVPATLSLNSVPGYTISPLAKISISNVFEVAGS